MFIYLFIYLFIYFLVLFIILRKWIMRYNVQPAAEKMVLMAVLYSLFVQKISSVFGNNYSVLKGQVLSALLR